MRDETRDLWVLWRVDQPGHERMPMQRLSEEIECYSHWWMS